MDKRIVVTGIGLFTSLGCNVAETWNAILEGKSGIKTVTEFDTSDIACKVGAWIDRSLFKFCDYFHENELKRVDDVIVAGVMAASEAIEDANLENVDKRDVAVVIGSGIGGIRYIEKTATTLLESGAKRVTPFFIPASLINLISGHVSIKYGLRGPNDANVAACASGANSIANAIRMIRCGDAKIAVAGASEMGITRLTMSGFASMKALSKNHDPSLASRPWDADRDGFVMGDGAGILVFEEYEHAKSRGAKIYCEVAGYGMSGDAHHISAPHPEGLGALDAMTIALNRANISPSEIDYINAHATSTPLGDVAELSAIRKLFENHSISNTSISSTKSSIGHLLGAAGSVEAIFGLLAIRDSVVPPTLNLHKPDEICDGLDMVPLVAKKKKVDIALSNSFGFGGTNISVILRRL